MQLSPEAQKRPSKSQILQKQIAVEKCHFVPYLRKFALQQIKQLLRGLYRVQLPRYISDELTKFSHRYYNITILLPMYCQNCPSQKQFE